MINNTEEDGINMIDFHSFCSMLKVKWIKHLLTNDNANWKVIPRYIFDCLGENVLFFYMNFQTCKHLPKMYLHLRHYIKMSFKYGYYIKTRLKKNTKSFAEIRKQIIWGNSYIRLNNKTLVFKT